MPLYAARGQGNHHIRPLLSLHGPHVPQPWPHQDPRCCLGCGVLPQNWSTELLPLPAPQERMAPRSFQDRQEQATAASGVTSLCPSLSGYAAAQQGAKQGTQSTNLEGWLGLLF